jgi:hypothetical protein
MNHGGGPGSLLEIVLVVIAALVLVFCFVQAVRYTWRPGEKSKDHVKRKILEENEEDRR